jgi:hypothetical protein
LHLRSSGMPFLFSLTVPQRLIFYLSSHQKGLGRKNCPCTVHGHVLSSCQFCYCGMSCCQVVCHALSVHPQVDCHVICVTSWVAELLTLDARLLILSGNILSKNHPSFEQYSHLVSWRIFWRVENFRKCSVVSEMQKLKYLWISVFSHHVAVEWSVKLAYFFCVICQFVS